MYARIHDDGSCWRHYMLHVWSLHALDVDECILPSPLLKQCQCVADQLPQAVIVLLAIVNAITQVLVSVRMQEQQLKSVIAGEAQH